MSKPKKQTKNALERMRLPELQARYREVTGESTRSANRKHLNNRIEEALAARAQPTPAEVRRRVVEVHPEEAPAPVSPVPTPTPTTPPPEATASAPQPRGRFAAMTVDELKAKYLEVVGRPTGSSSKSYMVWKIREAEKGRVPVGPRKERQGKGSPLDVRILPVRLEAAVVDKMDEAWRTRGIRNRMDFFRRALGHYLAHLGAGEAATLFASQPPLDA